MVLAKSGRPVVIGGARVIPPMRAVLVSSSELVFSGTAQASCTSVISVSLRSAQSPHFGELLLPHSNDVIPVNPSSQCTPRHGPRGDQRTSRRPESCLRFPELKCCELGLGSCHPPQTWRQSGQWKMRQRGRAEGKRRLASVTEFLHPVCFWDQPLPGEGGAHFFT